MLKLGHSGKQIRYAMKIFEMEKDVADKLDRLCERLSIIA